MEGFLHAVSSVTIILLLTALTSVLHMYLMNYLLDKILELKR